VSSKPAKPAKAKHPLCAATLRNGSPCLNAAVIDQVCSIHFKRSGESEALARAWLEREGWICQVQAVCSREHEELTAGSFEELQEIVVAACDLAELVPVAEAVV